MSWRVVTNKKQKRANAKGKAVDLSGFERIIIIVKQWSNNTFHILQKLI